MTSSIAVVTGASSGIGRATAIGLIQAGWTVALAGRRQDKLEESAALSGEPDRALCLGTDVADPAAVAHLFNSAVERFGRVDLVFNNAGRFAPSVPPDEVDVDTWRDVVNVNLSGAFYVAREAFRVMRAQSPQGGRIINNGSISAHAPRPGSIAYTATKHAVTGMTRSISLDGRRFNIACGQIDIGNAASDMTADMSRGMPQANGTTVPEPTIDPKHVVDAVLYMAGLPLNANVQFMTVMATAMPYIGRG